MSLGVGYIAGNSLEELMTQWELLHDQKVSFVLFDRKLFATEDLELNDWVFKTNSIQNLTTNFDRYCTISDLKENDVLVITSLNILFEAYDGAWLEFYAAHQRGVNLVVLDNGFHSGMEHGDFVISQMNQLFNLGAGLGDLVQKGLLIPSSIVVSEKSKEKLMLAKPQYAAIEQPFGLKPPAVFCPICGHEVVGEDGCDPCHHLAFLYVGAGGDFEHKSDDFESRLNDAEVEFIGFNDFPEILSQLGYDNKLLCIEITYGGMGCGPVRYSDILGFDYNSLTTESTEEN